MQRIATLLFAVLCAATLSAQTFDIPEQQRPLVTKRTATWCSNCGSWGWDFFELLLEDNAEDAEVFALHHSGNLKTDAAAAIAGNFEGTYQPVFNFNGVDINALSSNYNDLRASVVDSVALYNGRDAVAGTGIVLEREGDNLVVKTQTRFFTATAGQYYEAVYFLEKTRIAQQASQGNDAEHKYILRESLDGDAHFGVQLTDGAVAAGYETPVTERSFDLTAHDPNNLRMVAILWKLEGTTYVPVNSNGVDVSAATTGTYNIPLNVARLEARPNTTSGTTAISLIISYPTTARVELVDAQGRTEELLPTQRFAPGRLWMPLDLSAYPKGTYYVRLASADGSALTTVVVQ